MRWGGSSHLKSGVLERTSVYPGPRELIGKHRDQGFATGRGTLLHLPGSGRRQDSISSGIDSAGRVKGAFDACQRCYIYHQGYLNSAGELICRFCGNRYKLEAMEFGLESCVPKKLPFQVTAGP